MANITLMGASYTDVPAVTLPQTGGGTVTFYENGGGVSRETIVPATTVSATAGSWAQLTTGATPSLVAGEYYAYTINGVERVATATLANGYIYLSDVQYDWGGNGFALSYTGSGILFGAATTSGEYTVKVDKLTLSGGGSGTNQDYEDALTAFGVQSNLASGITALTTYANEITGESDTTLSDAVRSLADGYGQGGGSATPPWVSSVETVTIGANSVTNTNGVKSYFNSYTPYFAVVLKSAPTTNNQIVAMVNNAASALRYRSNAVGVAGVSTAYDAKLVEGTQYDIYHY